VDPSRVQLALYHSLILKLGVQQGDDIEGYMKCCGEEDIKRRRGAQIGWRMRCADKKTFVGSGRSVLVHWTSLAPQDMDRDKTFVFLGGFSTPWRGRAAYNGGQEGSQAGSLWMVEVRLDYLIEDFIALYLFWENHETTTMHKCKHLGVAGVRLSHDRGAASSIHPMRRTDTRSQYQSQTRAVVGRQNPH
jgi:hypothetical protein